MNIEILIGLAGLALAIGAMLAAVFALSSAQRWRGRCEALEANVGALRREVEHVASISARTGRRVQRVANEFSGVSERVELVETRASAGSAPLDQAIELARRGADKERLQQQFGLSSGEADLVARLHGRATPGSSRLN